MSNYSKEDYLDQLLYTMEDGSSAKKSRRERKDVSPEDIWEREIFGNTDFGEAGSSDEEEFLREFEKELLEDELPDNPEELPRGSRYLHNDRETDDPGTLEGGGPDAVQEITQEPIVDENAEFEGELPEKPEEQKEEQPEKTIGAGEMLDDAIGTFDDNIASEEPIAVEEPQEIDLSEMGDKDLMDLLSDDGDLSDLGQLLADEEQGNQIEGEGSIGVFEEHPTEETSQEQAQTAVESETADSPKRKKGKTSVFSKLSKLLFGDDQDDKVVLTDGNPDEVMMLSEENQQILDELEAADKKAAKQGKKKKKDKKEKKAPKPKKEKKKKEPKPKKEKKPKPVDNTPPLPRGPVIAIAVMVFSLMGLVLLGTSLLGYQANVDAAQEAYQQENYVEAFRKMQGLKVKSTDETLYNRLAALASVSEKYQAYLIFDHKGSKDIALDSLVCAYGRYQVNLPYAKEYDCEPQMEALKKKILKALKKDFSMTEKEAAELYRIKNRDDYTIQLREKLGEK